MKAVELIGQVDEKLACVTYRLACITRKGFRALALDALGLSKKSLTSANVACLKPAPP
jgi:hypothetical protein